MRRTAMQIPVLVEPKAGGGYVARTAFGWTAEGGTVDEAMKALGGEIARRRAAGARVLMMELPGDNPITRFAGQWADMPAEDLTAYQEAIRQHRAALDAEPNPQW